MYRWLPQCADNCIGPPCCFDTLVDATAVAMDLAAIMNWLHQTAMLFQHAWTHPMDVAVPAHGCRQVPWQSQRKGSCCWAARFEKGHAACHEDLLQISSFAGRMWNLVYDYGHGLRWWLWFMLISSSLLVEATYSCQLPGSGTLLACAGRAPCPFLWGTKGQHASFVPVAKHHAAPPCRTGKGR
eukprot:scaffold87863_cov22-Tisochrysis_lutea.AAC.1